MSETRASDPITLRTGVEVPQGVARATRLALLNLLQSGHGVALYELLELCRNPQHSLFGNSAEVLEKGGVLFEGRLHGAIRDVVLASFDGDFQFVEPYQS